MIASKRHNSWFLSSLFCILVVLIVGMAEAARGSDRLLHWFVLPVALCGILVIEDVVKWFRGDLDVFDPIGILGLFGVQLFLLAPLLHVSWDYWLDEVIPPRDWRPWLGGMAALNFVGLLAYRATRGYWDRADGFDAKRTRTWRLRPGRFWWCLGCALLLAGGLQLWVYARFGGLSGYLSAVEHKEHLFLGSGRIAMISESFPILAMMGYAIHLRWSRKTPSWSTLLVVLVAFVAAKMLFGGLHGSRSNTVHAMIWAVGIVHFCIRPVPKKLVIGGLVALLAFMYMYGFYKSAGLEGLQRALDSSKSRAAVESETRRTTQSTVLGDFSRSDVQAFLLYRTAHPDSDYQYALGRTYVGGVITIIPGPLWRDRPPTVAREGTEALRGRGAYRERPLTSYQARDKYAGRSSRVYGLAGEAMLNFGPLGVPVAFAALGVIVGCTRRWIKTLKRGDPRRLMLPLLLSLCLVALIGDSDNIVVLLLEDAVFPFFVLALVSTRRCRAGGPDCQPAVGNAGLPSLRSPWRAAHEF